MSALSVREAEWHARGGLPRAADRGRGPVMSPCRGNCSTCDGRDLAPVRIGLRREVLIFCSGCRATASAMGLRIVERRVASVPVARDRRAFLAPWRRHNLARDLTGALR